MKHAIAFSTVPMEWLPTQNWRPRRFLHRYRNTRNRVSVLFYRPNFIKTYLLVTEILFASL